MNFYDYFMRRRWGKKFGFSGLRPVVVDFTPVLYDVGYGWGSLNFGRVGDGLNFWSHGFVMNDGGHSTLPG